MQKRLEFYTNAEIYGNSLLLIGYDADGVRRKVRSVPSFSTFVPFVDGRGENSGFTSLSGEPLRRIEHQNIKEQRSFVRENRGNFRMFYNHRHLFELLGSQFSEMKPDLNKVKVGFLDIECEVNGKFPKPELAEERINAITLKHGDLLVCFGLDHSIDVERLEKTLALSTNPESSSLKFVYIQCEQETQLLERFLKIWESAELDIVTGWNVEFFDMPYLFNRIERVLGEDSALRFSPWGRVEKETGTNRFGKDETKIRISGITILDMLDLYKRFTQQKQESYSLGFIGQVEDLPIRKKKFDGDLVNLYKTDWQGFIEYNITDVLTLLSLDHKRKLVNLAMTIAYEARVTFEDIFSQVRLWEAIVCNALRDRNIVFEPNSNSGTEEQKAAREEAEDAGQIEGGYVKPPIPGFFDWSVSLDLDSLYPTLIRFLNISPETVVDIGSPGKLDLDEIIRGRVPLQDSSSPLIIAANGSTFTKNKVGFFPELVEKMYGKRKFYKSHMIDAETNIELIRAEINRRKNKLNAH